MNIDYNNSKIKISCSSKFSDEKIHSLIKKIDELNQDNELWAGNNSIISVIVYDYNIKLTNVADDGSGVVDISLPKNLVTNIYSTCKGIIVELKYKETTFNVDIEDGFYIDLSEGDQIIE